MSDEESLEAGQLTPMHADLETMIAMGWLCSGCPNNCCSALFVDLIARLILFLSVVGNA